MKRCDSRKLSSRRPLGPCGQRTGMKVPVDSVEKLWNRQSLGTVGQDIGMRQHTGMKTPVVSVEK